MHLQLDVDITYTDTYEKLQENVDQHFPITTPIASIRFFEVLVIAVRKLS